jgi:hypothetical protein
MHLGACGGKRTCTLIGAGKTDDLMTRMDQFLNNGRTDETRSTGNKDAHKPVSPF